LKILNFFPWKKLKERMSRFPGRKKILIGVVAGVLLLVFAVWKAGNIWMIKKNALALVNGRILTVEEVVKRVKKAPEVYQEYLKDDVRLIVEDQINQDLLLQEAWKRRRRYQKKLAPLVRQYYQELLVKEFVEQEIVSRVPVPEEQLRSYYQTHLGDFLLPEKYRLQEIVVATQEDAENILNRLILGEDFEAVARRDSISSSRERGGDLGWIPRDKLDPVLQEVVSQMKPGQILGRVIKTSVGYHIIKLKAHEPERFQTFEEARPYLRNLFIAQQKREAIEKYLRQLRDRCAIRIFEEKMEQLKERLQ